MLFNSLAFLAFFSFVFLGFYILPQKIRNPFLLLASFGFYLSWNPTFGILLLSVILISWSGGLVMQRKVKTKKIWLTGFILVLLAPLCFYKYLGFFLTNLHTLLPLSSGWGGQWVDYILPVGLSFFTFQAIGYLIDVYRGWANPLSLYDTALFISFFPQLNAGPIGRVEELAPQFKREHHFNYDVVVGGLALIMQGWFKKAVVADHLSEYIGAVYGNVGMHSGKTLLFASALFAIQLYADFSGYSDMAAGVARMLGFDLIINFRRPLLATSMRTFWARWHVSLTTWFRDYLFAPLYQSCKGKRKRLPVSALVVLNAFVFSVSGLWHGAGWTFIIWGLINGLYLGLEPLVWKQLPFMQEDYFKHKLVQRLVNMAKTAYCFTLFTVSLIFFRAANLAQAMTIFDRIFTKIGGSIYRGDSGAFFNLLIALGAMVILDLYNEYKDKDVAYLVHPKIWVTAVRFSLFTAFILTFGVLDASKFIYFQF